MGSLISSGPTTLAPNEYLDAVLGPILLAHAEGYRLDQIRPELESQATARHRITSVDYRATTDRHIMTRAPHRPQRSQRRDSMFSSRCHLLAVRAAIGLAVLAAAVAIPVARASAAERLEIITNSPVPHSATRTGPIWMMADSSALHVLAYRRVLDQPNVLLQGSAPLRRSPVPHGWVSIAEERWTSEAQFASDVAAGTIPRYVKVVHYDNEKWPDTPLKEQRRPGQYMRLFCQLAHEHGWLCATSPARDICSVAHPNFHGSLSDCYLTNRLAAEAAQYADYTDVQGQPLELRGTTAYAKFVAAAAAQAKAANPRIIALGNLSSSRRPRLGAASALNADARAVYDSAVAGFFMTITSAGALTAAHFFALFEPLPAVPEITFMGTGTRVPISTTALLSVRRPSSGATVAERQ